MLPPPAQDLPRRRPVWHALSQLFLDTQLDTQALAQIAATCAASNYTEPDLEHILWRELSPLLAPNLLSVAGEWQSFDLTTIEHHLLAHPPGPLRRYLTYRAAGRLARRDWLRIRHLLRRTRAHPSPTP